MTEHDFLVACALHLAGYTYDTYRGSHKPDRTKTRDCCHFTYRVLLDTMGPRVAQYEQALHLGGPSSAYANINAAVELGCDKVDTPRPGCWHLVQLWEDDEPTHVDGDPLEHGHTIFWWEPPSVVADPRGVCIQATNTTPPWTKIDRTWAQQLKRFGHARLAVLPFT